MIALKRKLHFSRIKFELSENIRIFWKPKEKRVYVIKKNHCTNDRDESRIKIFNFSNFKVFKKRPLKKLQLNGSINTHTNTVKRKSDCWALPGVLLKCRTPPPICAMCTSTRQHKSQQITTATHHKPHIIKILQTTEQKNGVPINLENQRIKETTTLFKKKQIQMLNYDKKIHNYTRLRDLFLLPNLHTNEDIFTREFVQDAKHCNKTDIFKMSTWDTCISCLCQFNEN